MTDSLKQLYKAGYEATIGLEVHVQLNTKTKIFSSDSNGSEAAANEHISAISMGHPGAMPVLNHAALEKAIMMGLVCNCKISERGFFDRKSYFYPDLPKGYQTTQDKFPICMGGKVEVFGSNLKQNEVDLHHIHLEEDAGKSIHDESDNTLIDLNRAGSPLIEIVTEPSITSGEVAAAFLQEIRRIVRYLEISEANMEKGELRCDANISIKPKGAQELGNKVEIKNMNSFSHVRRAVNYELERQLTLVQNQEEIAVETRTFDPKTGKTHGMRFKETMNDYRYFPCPDLPPILVSEEWKSTIQNRIEMTPASTRRYLQNCGLNEQDILFLTEEKEVALFAKAAIIHSDNPKAVANWLSGPIQSILNEHNSTLDESGLMLQHLVGLINLVESGKMSFAIAAKHLLPLLFGSDKSAEELAEVHNLLIIDNNDLVIEIVNEVLVSLPAEVAAFKKGKKQLLGLFMGEAMKRSKGKVNPKELQELLKRKLSE